VGKVLGVIERLQGKRGNLGERLKKTEEMGLEQN
jgi:hypothetical protein